MKQQISKGQQRDLADVQLRVVCEDVHDISVYLLTRPDSRIYGHQIMFGPYGISIQGDALDVQSWASKNVHWFVADMSDDYFIGKFYRRTVVNAAGFCAGVRESIEEADLDEDKKEEALECVTLLEADAADFASERQEEVLDLIATAMNTLIACGLNVAWEDVPYDYPDASWLLAIRQAFIREWQKRSKGVTG